MNWWFPGWLGRIVPEIDVEGNEFFDEPHGSESQG
jgi:hypothetical protein